MSKVFVVVVAAALGLVFGSFGTVVAWRVPRKESIVKPGSHCPSCNTLIKPYDNIPIVSWLALGGKCRACKARVSVRYPLVELGVAALFAAVAWRVPSYWEIPAYCAAALVLVILTDVDIELHRLPTPIVYGGVLVCGSLLVLAAAGVGYWHALLTAAICGVAFTAFFFVIHFASPKGMGRGDVRLAGLCGMLLGFLGWRIAVVGFMAAVIAAGLFAIGLLAAGNAGRKTAIPFGPFLALGAMFGVLVGHVVAGAWLSG